MQEGFVQLNGIPTKILTYGRWIEDIPENFNDKLILVIPGNPGVVGFYKQFMEILWKQQKCPVWIIGHSGHEYDGKQNFPKELDLKEQIKQKVTFIEKYVPENTKLHLIGHSIGSYMTLELLKETAINGRIIQTHSLFPTIENMVNTSNGRFLWNWVKPLCFIVIFLSWIFSILPKFLSISLLKTYMHFTNLPRKDIENIYNLISPKILQQVFYLAFDELRTVKTRDNENIRKNLEKINILYGDSDNWCTPEFYVNIRRDFPNIRAEISKYQHAFVFHDNENVAKIVNEWINNDRK